VKTIGAYEAKTQLPKLLQRVAKGESITITKHGVPLATLQPAGASIMKPAHEIIEQLRQFRSKHYLGGLSLRKMIDEGRS
jgi:prevent-host-death family protein